MEEITIETIETQESNIIKPVKENFKYINKIIKKNN